MVFSSMTFLCVFFPVVFALYYILPGLRARNVLLILASLLFYAYGEPAYVLLMIFSIVMNYFFGRMMNTRNAGLRKAALLIAVVINIGLLVVFKYTDQSACGYTDPNDRNCIADWDFIFHVPGAFLCD